MVLTDTNETHPPIHPPAAYFITTLAAAVSHLQQLEVEEVTGDNGETTLRVVPPLARSDSIGGGGSDSGNGGPPPPPPLEEEEDLLERWGPTFSGEETRRALEYLDGWLAMELNMEETIELLEGGGWW